MARTRPSGAPVAASESDRDELQIALEQARRGEDIGFLTLYRTLQPRLLRFLAVRTTDGADDVAAETWLQVVRDLQRFRGDAEDFRGWLFTVARNRAVDAARAAKVRPSVPVADVTAIGVAAVAPSAEVQALEHLSTEQAMRLVATLPSDVAEMVALRVIAGLDAASVGEIVGKTPGAVRVAVHRALATLCGRPDVSPWEVTS
jgi:RNA polymerase sigma-70 factor (ECF subfamily)